MAAARPLSRLLAVARGPLRLPERLSLAIRSWRAARAERQALLDVLVKPGDRLLVDAGVERGEAERRLDVSRISPWDRWQL